jgi:hypothetical protein
MCSVPMYEWCERSASSWVRVRTYLADSLKRSNGYISLQPCPVAGAMATNLSAGTWGSTPRTGPTPRSCAAWLRS